MAINFPDTPNPNDVFTDGGKSWIWDGTTWKIYSTATSGIALGDLSVNTTSVGTASLSYNNTTGVFTYTPPNLSSFITQQYTLPTASTTVLGGVKVDGSSINIDANGVISGASTYTLPTASTTVLGGVKIDGTTITINNGVISGASSVPTSITVANESTDTTCFPLFTTDATGDLAPKTVTSLKLNSSSGQLEAGSFKKTGGSSSEFLKADGSIDSSTYASNLNDLGDVDTTGLVNGKILKYDASSTSWVIADDSGGGSGGGNVAVGSIMIWSGATNQIPTGWQLCDGTNGSPDLRDKFIVGAGNSYSVDDTGGSADATLVSHSHTTNSTSKTLTGDVRRISEGYNAQGTASGLFTKTNDGYNNITGSSSYSPVSGFTFDGTHTHGTDSQGSSATNANLPPYYALCYIYCTAAGSNQTFIGLSDTPVSHSNNKWLQSNGSSLVWADPPNSLSNIADSAQGVNVTGKVATTDGVDIDIGGNLNAAGTSVDFGSATISFSGASISGLNSSDVNLANISDNAQGVAVTGKVATTDGMDIDIGGSINAAGTSIDFQNTTISFTGASIGGLQSTINAGVDVHLNKTTANNGEVLSWNGTDYDWVASSSGGGNVAVGSIMIWSGAVSNIPTGWQLCDGTNGSPDLRDKFVAGAGNSYSVNDTGGSTTSTGTGSVSFGSAGTGSASTAGSSSATVSITVDTLPPYYALCYIYCTSAGSNQSFIGLDDTPSSFTADKWLKVNSGGTALEWTDAPTGTTINNNADNRIITGSSSATELNAESSLTYDGNILSFGDDKKIRYGSNFRMEMYADSSTGYIKMPADGSGAFPLEIHSGSSEVIKIDDGNTQILTGIKDKDGDLGTSGQVLSSTGTQVNWIDVAGGGALELVTSSVLSSDAIKVRYDSNILQTNTIYRMVGHLLLTGNAYGGFDMTPSFYDTSTNTQYGQAFSGQSNTAYSSPANHESICGPFTPVPTSNQYGLQNAVWYDEQGSLSWWLRTDQQNNIAITTMYFVADFSTYLGPWMHMTFGSMNNRYHTGSFTGGWNLNPSSTYINNMEYGIVGGGQQIKAGSATYLYKYT
tara:strand:+ start:142 stop:3348 length:3207 start_codon:yes stop_codon:yes gene_type:complete